MGSPSLSCLMEMVKSAKRETNHHFHLALLGGGGSGEKICSHSSCRIGMGGGVFKHLNIYLFLDLPDHINKMFVKRIVSHTSSASQKKNLKLCCGVCLFTYSFFQCSVP